MDVKITFNALPAFAEQTEVEVQEAVVRSAMAIAETAKQNAPVRTGRLRDSINATGGTVEASAPYAGVVEARTPFLAPATDSMTPQFIESVGEAVDRAAKKVGR
jgi:hypothetical protein